MKEVTDADPPQAHLLPLWLESSLTLVAWNLSVALTKKENSQVLCIFASVFDKNHKNTPRRRIIYVSAALTDVGPNAGTSPTGL